MGPKERNKRTRTTNPLIRLLDQELYRGEIFRHLSIEDIYVLTKTIPRPRWNFSKLAEAQGHIPLNVANCISYYAVKVWGRKARRLIAWAIGPRNLGAREGVKGLSDFALISCSRGDYWAYEMAARARPFVSLPRRVFHLIIHDGPPHLPEILIMICQIARGLGQDADGLAGEMMEMLVRKKAIWMIRRSLGLALFSLDAATRCWTQTYPRTLFTLADHLGSPTFLPMFEKIY